MSSNKVLLVPEQPRVWDESELVAALAALDGLRLLAELLLLLSTFNHG